jgi:hypothetical protein
MSVNHLFEATPIQEVHTENQEGLLKIKLLVENYNQDIG